MREIERLQVAMRLLKMDHRVARLTAVEQTRDEATGESFMLVEFVELNDEGHPIGTPRQFRIRGDMVYIDHWVVKFDDQYVEQADIDRGTSLVLFRRIFGEMQQPIEGFPLDEVGTAPTSYARGGQMSDFEKQIWDDFWTIANDKTRAEAMGIRAAHGARFRCGSRRESRTWSICGPATACRLRRKAGKRTESATARRMKPATGDKNVAFRLGLAHT
jgi:hypothetical protein